MKNSSHHPQQQKYQRKLQNYKLFIELFDYWSRKFKLGKIPTSKDDRLNSHLITEFYSKSDIRVKYNSKLLSESSYALIASCVFHELGHIKYNLPYKTEEDKMFSEYVAEDFSIKMIIKYYPELTNEVISYNKKLISSALFRLKHPIHWEAFNRVVEYH